jgi:D-alanine-D-alanine ligase
VLHTHTFWKVRIVPIEYELWRTDPALVFAGDSFAGIDCVVNFFEGFTADPAAEITCAAILEQKHIPFTGNSSAVLSKCLDKEQSKQLLSAAGITVPRGIRIDAGFDGVLPHDLAFPVFIKPCCEDASVGIDRTSLCTDAAAAIRTLRTKLEAYPKGLLLEEFIDGAEYSVSFFCGTELEMVAFSVIDYAECKTDLAFLTYGSKWDTEDPSYENIRPAVFADPTIPLWKELEEKGRQVKNALQCNGYFRVDFRSRNGELYVIDVNPNPDLNEDAGFARLAYHRNYTYADILTRIITDARSVYGTTCH